MRQLELEQEKIIHTKEKEMLEHLLKQGKGTQMNDWYFILLINTFWLPDEVRGSSRNQFSFPVFPRTTQFHYKHDTLIKS